MPDSGNSSETFDVMKFRDLLALQMAGHGNDDLAPRALKSILKQAGLEKKQ
jgi:predicted RNA binding protein YcfA (HicA-like mRNA interferase family)